MLATEPPLMHGGLNLNIMTIKEMRERGHNSETTNNRYIKIKLVIYLLKAKTRQSNIYTSQISFCIIRQYNLDTKNVRFS